LNREAKEGKNQLLPPSQLLRSAASNEPDYHDNDRDDQENMN
jgi:hypothetical protein